MPVAKKLSLINEIMQSYPEAGGGNCMHCFDWDYDQMVFAFVDIETGKKYVVRKIELLHGFDILISKILQGDLNFGIEANGLLDAGNWDSYITDALVQCATLGDVVYG